MQKQKREERRSTSREKLPDIGFVEEDVKSTIRDSVKSHIEWIHDELRSNYQRRRGDVILPTRMIQALRAKSCTLYLGYYEEIMKELKEAAENPQLKF